VRNIGYKFKESELLRLTHSHLVTKI